MYGDYDFGKDREWLQFVQQLGKDIVPERMEYLKQLWYKSNVNKNHELQLEKTNSPREGWNLAGQFYTVENVFKFTFLVTLFTSFGLLFNLLALIRQVRNGKDKLHRRIIYNEFFHNLIFMIIIMCFNRYNNYIILGPVLMHAWIGVCEYIYTNQKSIYERLEKWVDRTRQNRDLMIMQKQKLEILLVPIASVGKVLDYGSWVLVIVLMMFIKIKFMLNPRQKQAWVEIDHSLAKQIHPLLYRAIKQIAVPLFTL